MSRGGRREGAGGKPTWRYGKTKTIRVPELLSEKVLEIARILDTKDFEEIEAEELLEKIENPKSLDLSGLPIRSLQDGRAVYLSDLIAAGYEIRPKTLVRNLKSESGITALKRQLDEAIDKYKRLEGDK